MPFIHQLSAWPTFTWQADRLESLLGAVRNRQGRLFGWHGALFPTGRSGLYPVRVGAWRPGPMQVVSGALERSGCIQP